MLQHTIAREFLNSNTYYRQQMLNLYFTIHSPSVAPTLIQLKNIMVLYILSLLTNTKALINYMAFLSTLPKWYDKNKNEVTNCFNVIDKEKKGYVTEEEFNLIFDNKLNLEDLLLIMEKIDSDKDGKITYEDMVNFFK